MKNAFIIKESLFTFYHIELRGALRARDQRKGEFGNINNTHEIIKGKWILLLTLFQGFFYKCCHYSFSLSFHVATARSSLHVSNCSSDLNRNL